MSSDDVERILRRIDSLEDRMDGHFGRFAEYLNRTKGTTKEVARPRGLEPVATTGGVTQFQIGFDDDRDKLTFDPENWDYTTEHKVQWVSKAGAFTINVNRRDNNYGDRRSPFAGKDTITSKFDPNEKLWKTEPIQVEQVFSDAERAERHLLSERPVSFYYIVSLERNGQIYVDQGQHGDGC